MIGTGMDDNGLGRSEAKKSTIEIGRIFSCFRDERKAGGRLVLNAGSEC